MIEYLSRDERKLVFGVSDQVQHKSAFIDTDENQQSAYEKTKVQTSFAVTAKLVRAFVFTTWIV